MGQQELAVEARTASGSSAARRLRRRGLVPAVLYGRGIEPVAIAISDKSLRELLHGGAQNVLVRLRLAGASEPAMAMLKELQRHPITGGVLNVDFHKVSLTEKIAAQVPIVLTGEAPGIKQGGVLDQVLRQVEVECLPTDIPPSISLDVSGLGIGHSLHVSDLVAPEGVVIADDPTSVVATITRVAEEKPAVVAPEVAAAEEEAAAAPAEGEEAGKAGAEQE